jgi:hypothetical protein
MTLPCIRIMIGHLECFSMFRGPCYINGMLARQSMILYHVPVLLVVCYIDHLIPLTYKVSVQFARIPSIKLELRVSRGSQIFQEGWSRSHAANGGGLLLLMGRCRVMMGVRA